MATIWQRWRVNLVLGATFILATFADLERASERLSYTFQNSLGLEIKSHGPGPARVEGIGCTPQFWIRTLQSCPLKQGWARSKLTSLWITASLQVIQQPKKI